MKKFHSDETLELAKGELKDLLLREGLWGETIKEKQLELVPPPGKTFSNEVERVI